MLGVTTYLSTNVATVPLLWILPLALYLLSFILVFSGLTTPWHRYLVWAMPVLLLLQVARMSALTPRPLFLFPMHLLTFFVVALVCHGELARRRPPAGHLTEFYLWLSVGGVLGGLLNAVVAPLLLPGLASSPPLSYLPAQLSTRLQRLFATVIEYPLMLVLAALLWPAPRSTLAWPPLRWLSRLAPWALAAAVAALVPWQPPFNKNYYVLHRERSFFGILSVKSETRAILHTFTHGTILHGAQFRDSDQRRLPLVYYARTGPIGQIFAEFHGPKAKERVGLVGLGVGSLASYAESGQEFTFFEIDPAVERIARNPQYFTFLTDAEARGAKVRVELGDARLSLEQEGDGRYGLLVLDAFSGDAIPTHLLTREALQLYRRKLAADGVLAFHISNNYLDLEPVLANLAHDAGLVLRVQNDQNITAQDLAQKKESSTWAIMARQEKDFGKLAGDRMRWKPAVTPPASAVWTDSYSNILQVMRWY
jgi:hypothetical protein